MPNARIWRAQSADRMQNARNDNNRANFQEPQIKPHPLSRLTKVKNKKICIFNDKIFLGYGLFKARKYTVVKFEYSEQTSFADKFQIPTAALFGR